MTPKPSQPKGPPSLTEKQTAAEDQAAKWGAVALSNGLSPQAKQVASNLARSMASAGSLYQKAADYQHQSGETAEADPMLDQLLQLPPPESKPAAPKGSTNSETFGPKT